MINWEALSTVIIGMVIVLLLLVPYLGYMIATTPEPDDFKAYYRHKSILGGVGLVTAIYTLILVVLGAIMWLHSF